MKTKALILFLFWVSAVIWLGLTFKVMGYIIIISTAFGTGLTGVYYLLKDSPDFDTNDED